MKINRTVSGMLASVLLLTGCAGSVPERSDDGKLSVVATNFAMYDLARAVAGDACNVTMLIPPGSESHDFEATLADIAKISEADVFVHVGSEDWVDDVFNAMGALADEIIVIDALDVIGHDGPDHVSGEVCAIEEEHNHEHDEEEDEHVWTSVGNAEVLMDAIADAVMEADGSLSETVMANKDAYAAQLDVIDTEMAALAASTDKKLVVADRFPFAYMAARYGFEYEAAFSGCSSDTEPSLAVINTLIETVKNEEISAIFVTESSDRKTAEAVASETGAEILELHSAQSISKEEFENGVTYADLMERNLEVLRKALGFEE